MAMDDAQRHPRQICKVRMPLSRYYPDVHRLALFSLANTDICITRYLDAIMEQKNDRQKERAVGHSLMNALHFTPVQPAMQHVRQAFRATEFGDEKDDTGVRSSLPNEVNLIVKMFCERIGTGAPRTHSVAYLAWR